MAAEIAIPEAMPAIADKTHATESQIEVSWYSARFFLALSALEFSILASRPHIVERIRPRTVVPALVVVVTLLIAGAFVLPYIPVPDFFVFHKSLDVLVGLAFTAAFIGFVRKGIGALGSIHSWISISLMMQALAHLLFIPLSSTEHDGADAAGHLIKLFSYMFVIIGITLDAQRAYRRESLAADELGRVNEALNERNLELTTLHNDLATLTRIAAIASSSVSIDDHFDEFCEELKRRVPADRILVVTVSQDQRVGRVEAVWGLMLRNRGLRAEVGIENTMMYDIVFDRSTLVWDEDSIGEAIERDPRLQTDFDAGIKSWISTPVIAKGQVIGALMARSKKSHAYGFREASFLEQVAAQIAGPMEMSRQVFRFQGPLGNVS